MSPFLPLLITPTLSPSEPGVSLKPIKIAWIQSLNCQVPPSRAGTAAGELDQQQRGGDGAEVLRD